MDSPRRKNVAHHLAAGLLLLGSVLGATPAGAGDDRREGKPVQVRVTMDDLRAHSRENKSVLEREVKAANGETLEVTIETQALGYLWKLKDHDRERFREEKAPNAPPRPGDPRPGGKAEKVTTFTVLKAGGDLEFVPTRSDGKSDPNTPKIKIVVKPK